MADPGLFLSIYIFYHYQLWHKNEIHDTIIMDLMYMLKILEVHNG